MHRKKPKVTHPLLGHENVLHTWDMDPAVETCPAAAGPGETLQLLTLGPVKLGPLLQSTHEMMRWCLLVLPSCPTWELISCNLLLS